VQFFCRQDLTFAFVAKFCRHPNTEKRKIVRRVGDLHVIHVKDRCRLVRIKDPVRFLSLAAPSGAVFRLVDRLLTEPSPGQQPRSETRLVIAFPRRRRGWERECAVNGAAARRPMAIGRIGGGLPYDLGVVRPRSSKAEALLPPRPRRKSPPACRQPPEPDDRAR
jgi:hypothetical protein